MGLTDICVKRPITTLMLMLVLIFFGMVAFFGLPRDLFPNISQPSLRVVTTYSGTAPQEMESLITESLEEVLTTVKGVKRIRSTSGEGYSNIVLDFDWGTKMDFAAMDVREKIDQVKGLLPEDADDPRIERFDPSAQPVIVINISSRSGAISRITPQELRQIAQYDMKPRLERLEGVAAVKVSGGRVPEILVAVDSARLEAYNISIDQVTQRLEEENLSRRGGRLEEARKEIIVRTAGEFTSVDEVKRVIVTSYEGTPIYLENLARVELVSKEQRDYARLNRSDCVELAVYKEAEGNTVRVSKAVQGMLERLRKGFPALEIFVSFDQSDYINESIQMVMGSARIGLFLTVIVLFLFLRSIRSTFVISLALPVSIIAAFMLFPMLRMSMNIFSLAGLALGVGMVVDNAIVILENIFRHITEGREPKQAAVTGTLEVGTAVMASTLTTLAVFLPIAFVKGLAGQIFRDLSCTVVFCLIFSLFVALTLIPMLSSRFLKRKEEKTASIPSGRESAKGPVMMYSKMLGWVVETWVRRVVIVVIVVAVFIGSFAFVPGTEFFPSGVQREFEVSMRMPVGTSLPETDRIVRIAEGIIQRTAPGSALATRVLPCEGHIIVTLKEIKGAEEALERVRERLERVAGADIRVRQISPLQGLGAGSGGGSDIAIKVAGPDLDELRGLAQVVSQELELVDGLYDIGMGQGEGKPELQISIDRERAAGLGLSVDSIGSTIKSNLSGEVTTSMRRGNQEIDILVKGSQQSLQSVDSLRNLVIRSPLGLQVPLYSVAEIRRALGPVEVEREERQRIMTVTAEVSKGVALGDVTGRLANPEHTGLLDKLSKPEGYSFKVGGASETMRDSFSALSVAMIIAVLLVYMVMAAQFESLIHPFVIMFSVPLSLIGVFPALALLGLKLSITAFIGVIMLAGIVVNNAIILIDYINILRARGLDRNDAILLAGRTRLRPIFMTATTTVFGMVPLALGLGPGAELYRPLAVVVISGLTLSTLLTLVFIPTVYCLVDDVQDLASLLVLKLKIMFKPSLRRQELN